MNNTVRLPLFGIVLIVVLRMAIGWQFLYEGMWKISTLSTPRPWTAEGYLRNSAGPFRGLFREMAGDANDFSWLDYNSVSNDWDVWKNAFVARYALDESQTAQLNDLLNGPSDFRVELAALPKGVEIRGTLANVVMFDAKAKRLICPREKSIKHEDGTEEILYRMVPRERDALLALAKGDDDASRKYRAAVTRLYTLATRQLSYRERLAASLKGDPERVGLKWKEGETLIESRTGQIDLYKAQVARYEANLARAQQSFNYDHLSRQYEELMQLKSNVVGPVKGLDKALKEDAIKLLTTDQIARGPVSLPWKRIDWINIQTIAALTILGALLIVGLASRLAALGGAGLLTMFYLAMPPWPGVPEAPGPEHSLVINKNLIEVLALLAIAGLPTGQWFGLDSLISRCCGRCGNSGAGESTAGAESASSPAT